MLQDGGLYSTARPLELVRYVASLYPDPDDPAALLDGLGIDPATRTTIRRLSGGEQQRVKCAAALVGRPELAFLDEPTAGLDSLGRRTFHDRVRSLVDRGTTIVLTTHLMDDVERLADHVVVVARGRDVRQGTIAELVGEEESVSFRGPMHADVSGLRSVLPDGGDVVENPAGHYRVTGAADPMVLSAIAAWCGQQGVPHGGPHRRAPVAGGRHRRARGRPVSATGSPVRRALAHAGWETRLLLRNGEQVLLTLVIPVGIMLGLTLTDVLVQTDGDDRIPRALATVLAVSVISAAFTSLAIATAFERRSGALRFLGTTPLTRTELLAGKALATLLMTALSAAVACATAVAVGWRPVPGSAWALPRHRARHGGVRRLGHGPRRAAPRGGRPRGRQRDLPVPADVRRRRHPAPRPCRGRSRRSRGWLPSGALVEALTSALVDGTAPSASAVAILLGWAAAGTALAARTFRWS